MAESTCKHGATEPHGEIGKDWCAGPPRSWYFEAGWRRQLEDQMNLDPKMFTRFAEPPSENNRFEHSFLPTELRHQRLTDDELHTVQVLNDSLKDFIPMGWSASWGEHWYADPRAPLQYRDRGGEVSFDGEHWTNALVVGTPIYDALVAERGNPRHY